jgi:hypothetical protein
MLLNQAYSVHHRLQEVPATAVTPAKPYPSPHNKHTWDGCVEEAKWKPLQYTQQNAQPCDDVVNIDSSISPKQDRVRCSNVPEPASFRYALQLSQHV